MRPFVLFLLGALVGAAGAGWISASLIHWWAVPPFPSPGCDYSPAIEYAVKHMLMWEGIGAAVGAVVLLVLYFVFKSSKKKPTQPPLAAPPAAG
jgi:hypothetical protein